MQYSCIPVLGLHREKRRLDARGAAEGKVLGFCAGHRSSGMPQSPAISPCCASPGPARTQQGQHCRLTVSCSSSSSSYWSGKGGMLGWRVSRAVLEQRPASSLGMLSHRESEQSHAALLCAFPAHATGAATTSERFPDPAAAGSRSQECGVGGREEKGRESVSGMLAEHPSWLGGEVGTSVGASARCGKRGRTRGFWGASQSLPRSSSSFPTPA